MPTNQSISPDGRDADPAPDDPGLGPATADAADRRHRAARAATILALLLLAVVIVKDAWVSEDAYITFRTIDNWQSGHGLR